MDELELYPGVDPLKAMRNGVRAIRTHWRRALAYGLAITILFGFVGYRWVTTVTPVDSTRAVELFRAERGSDTESEPVNDRVARSEKKKEKAPKPQRPSSQKGRGTKLAAAAPASDGNAKGSVSNNAGSRTDRSSDQSVRTFSPPKEGVYSWATDGYEQVSGARRQFPRETQRVLTSDGRGRWTEHHYFSEERESWTSFHWSSRGAEVEQQRNKVTFGPVTNNSTIDFTPPMLVGPRDLEVGYKWSDTWQGDTSGNYSSEIFERTTINIGGTDVEVWGISYEINLRGEQEGRVTAEVWLAPDHGIVVKEHYRQDIESSGARYQAEWTQTVRSLEPRR